MRILIIGAGDVGSALSNSLSETGHDVVLLEGDPRRARRVDEEQNVKVVNGDGASAEVLKKANVEGADFLLAMTQDDRSNLIACSIGKALGAQEAIARVHDQVYQESSLINYQHHFNIDHFINPEALAAVEIAKTIRHPGRVAIENLARGQIEVHQVTVTHRSKIIGKPLKEIRFPKNLRIGYVQRGETVEVARADTEIKEGDLVTFFGKPEVLLETRNLFDPDTTSESVRVVVFGGDETGISLIRLLSNRRFKLRVIDKREAQCTNLAERFPNITVIQGDATSLRLLKQEQIESADFFVACTKDDENNIMTGLQASRLGAQHTQIVLTKADYQDIIDELRHTLGIEKLVSPRIATVNEILHVLSRDSYYEIAQLPGKVGKILEVRVSPGSAVVGKTMKEIPWPESCVVVGLLHKYSAKVPGPDDKIIGGDRVILITREDNIEKLRRQLAER